APIVLAWIESCDPKPLLIVDSLVAFHEGDENDAGQMRQFLNRCRRCTSRGATVVLIHHCGKAESSKPYRGSSDLAAGIDLGLHLVNVGDGNTLGKLLLKPFKKRILFPNEMSYDYADGRVIRCESAVAPRAADE